MNSKTVPFSVRLTHEDAEFLGQLNISGANTPSDKLRAIISEKRKNSSEPMDHQRCFHDIQKIMGPAIEAIRKSETDHGIHSGMINRMFEWVPDIIACIVSCHSDKGETLSPEELIELERSVADRVFRVMESVLQMGATKWFHSYDPTAMAKRSEPVLELAGLISGLQQRTSKE